MPTPRKKGKWGRKHVSPADGQPHSRGKNREPYGAQVMRRLVEDREALRFEYLHLLKLARGLDEDRARLLVREMKNVLLEYAQDMGKVMANMEDLGPVIEVLSRHRDEMRDGAKKIQEEFSLLYPDLKPITLKED